MKETGNREEFYILTVAIRAYYLSKTLKRLTYICGTIRTNRKFLLVEVKSKKKRRDSFSAQNLYGVNFVKLTDKRTKSKKHIRSY